MTHLAVAIAVIVAGGVAARAAGSRERLANALGAASVLVGAALGLFQALRVLLGVDVAPIDLAWSVPGGRLVLGIDPLSAFFLIPLFLLGGVAAIYGVAYWRRQEKQRPVGGAWLWSNALIAAMAVVLTARNAVLFLVSWEAMALASYFLVVFHDERAEVRRAGWIYLVATHLGTAFLLALFAALGTAFGSLDFAAFGRTAGGAGALFGLALVGFGTKAGLFPFHIWLPEAHPAAPSPASALLSGVMIKTGIYGILRALTWLGPPRLAFGIALLALGVVSGIAGVLLALAQRDLKRLLAYSSVENVGVVAIGLGIGVLGASADAPAVAAFGFAGALLHVWSHAIMKGLLFLGAGGVLAATGTTDVERLGGLMRSMPVTGIAFAVGAAAICAVPPLAGFPGEFALLLASFRGITEGIRVPFLLTAVATLGLVGGLAMACFAKAVGIAFLGEPRAAAAAHAREPGGAMAGSCAALAFACVGVGLASPLLLALARPVVEALAPGSETALAELGSLLWEVSRVGSTLLATTVAVALGRQALLRGREVRTGATWDCGYTVRTSRMQYSGASFVQPITQQFESLLGVSRQEESPGGLLPRHAGPESPARDPAEERLFRPLFAALDRLAGELRWLQSGSVHSYVLYVVLATAALFLWKLG